MPEGKKIFFSALDWGFGHATRSVALIRKLEKQNEVVLGVTPLTSMIWNKEFPHLKKIELPAYNVSYSNIFPLWLKLLLDSPGILRVINKEHRVIEDLIDQFKFDLVISDSRFGLFTSKAKTIFITHQVFIKTPFLQNVAQAINRKFISRFDEIWVPDHEGLKGSLGGELSHGRHFHANVKYIGPVSRLFHHDSPPYKQFTDIMILSGPQPKRKELEQLFMRYAQRHKEKRIALISPDETANLPENLKLFCDPSPKTISELLSSSDQIWCRSGYSTLMDLHTCKVKSFILIPTPGQTEQEYLAGFWKEQHGALVVPEDELERI